MAERTRWGFSMRQKDDCLFVRTSSHEIRYEGWPVLRGWARRGESEDWKSFVPYIDLLSGAVAPWAFLKSGFPAEQLRKEGAEPSGALSELWNELAPVRRFFSNVPTEVKALVTPFLNRQWQLLQFLQVGGEPAIELMRCNRGLAFSVALNSLLLPEPLEVEELRALLGEGVLPALKRLGFPATEQSARILVALPHKFCTPKIIRRLRDCLHDPEIKRALGDCETVHPETWEVLSTPCFRLITPSFLEEFNGLREIERSELLHCLIESCAGFEELYRRRSAARSIESIRELERFARDVKETKRKRLLERLRAIAFPPPPLEGNEQVVPIMTAEQLEQAWNALQLDDYPDVDAIVGGEVFFYRFTGPEAAVIMVESSSKTVRITEITGYEGRPVFAETLVAIEEWLRSAKVLR